MITLTRTEDPNGYPKWETDDPLRVFAYLNWQNNDQPFTVKAWLRLNDQLDIPLFSLRGEPFERELVLQSWLHSNEEALDERIQTMANDILDNIFKTGITLLLSKLANPSREEEKLI